MFLVSSLVCLAILIGYYIFWCQLFNIVNVIYLAYLSFLIMLKHPNLPCSMGNIPTLLENSHFLFFQSSLICWPVTAMWGIAGRIASVASRNLLGQPGLMHQIFSIRALVLCPPHILGGQITCRVDCPRHIFATYDEYCTILIYTCRFYPWIYLNGIRSRFPFMLKFFLRISTFSLHRSCFT